MWIVILLVINISLASSLDGPDDETTDGGHSRKILGSSVVTSVSVIMDTGNGTKAVYTDSLGRPLSKPTASSELASPIDLLNPDRYEFYTFDDDGNLVRRLMSLEEIRGIVATGDSDGLEFDSLSSQHYIPENRVNDVLSNVQGVLKNEMELHKIKGDSKPIFDTPDVSDSWSMILPAIFGNSGADISPEKPFQHVTPDTIMIETTRHVASTTEGIVSSSSTAESVTQQTITTQERSPSSPSQLESIKENDTEANLIMTTQEQSNASTTESENISNTEVISTESILSIGQKTSSTESIRIPVSSTTKISDSQTNEMQQEQSTMSQPISESSKTASQEFSSTVKYLHVFPTDLPAAGSVGSESSMAMDVSSTERPIFISSTYPPLVRSTELTPTTTEEYSTEKEISSSTERIYMITEESSTELSSSTTKLFNSSLNILSSSTTPSTEGSSLVTLPLSSTMKETLIETSTEEPTTTTEKVINSDPTEINEKNFSITPYKSDETHDSASEIIDEIISTANPELDSEIVGEIIDQSDNRFETTHQQNLITTEVEPTTTDMNFMGSIQQLLSQTLQNVDDIVMDLNETDLASATDENKESAVKITTTIPLSDSSENLASSEVTEPSIYQIISSSNISSTRNVSRTKDNITNISVNSDSPMMKITILNPDSDSQKPNGTSEGPSKNTKTDKTSESNTSANQLGTTDVSKHDEVNTITESYQTELSTESSRFQTDKFSTYMLPTFESVDMEYSTEELKKPSIEIVINENDDNDTVQFHSTTELPVIYNSTKIPVIQIVEEISSEGTPMPIMKETVKPIIKDTDKSESNWTLVPTIKPHDESMKRPQNTSSPIYPELIQPPQPIDLEPKPLHGFGLEESTSTLDRDIYQYSQLCNELAFTYWKTVTAGLSSARSIFVSPFGAISLLAMIFLGARGSTSGEMDELLKLDDMVTFNPHLIFKNVSESIDLEKSNSGVVASAIVRELFSDKKRGMLLPFYKARAKAFYDGFVEEINFGEVGDVIRRRTNLQVKKYSDGKIGEFLKDSFIIARSPLAGISVNVFQTDCTNTSTEGRDGEMHFVVLPSIRQRRLVPIPAVVYRSNFLAGYDPSLDATAVSLGTKDQIVSTILVIPGQQGMPAPGDGLARLEKSLVESSFKTGAWSRLLRSLIPRTGLEVQIPRFIHKSVINATMALKKLGFNELFDKDRADLSGMNGVQHELYLSDILQINSFATCGELRNGDSHHSEIYPANVISRRLEKSFNENSLDFRMTGFHHTAPLPSRPRQARVPEIPKLRFDRPFLYFVRHNPTGLILHIGRFNPRLLP